MKALELAAYVVNKCVNDPSLGITNLQLQKIMYFLQIRSLNTIKKSYRSPSHN